MKRSLYFLICIFLAGSCNKKVDKYTFPRQENISKQEIMSWLLWYNLLLPNAPKADTNSIQKTFFKNTFVIKVPLLHGDGELFFIKDKFDRLSTNFIRKVDEKNISATGYSGMIELIDFSTFKHLKVEYKNGKSSAFENFILKNSIKSNMRSTSSNGGGPSWFSQLLWCIGRYLFAVPAKDDNGNWTLCSVLGGGGQPKQMEGEIFDGGGGQSEFNWLDFYLYYNLPNVSQNYPDYNISLWFPYYGGFYGNTNANYYSNFSQNIYDPNSGEAVMQKNEFGILPIQNDWNSWDKENPFLIEGIPSEELGDEPLIDLGYVIDMSANNDEQYFGFPKRKIAQTISRFNNQESSFHSGGDLSGVNVNFLNPTIIPESSLKSYMEYLIKFFTKNVLRNVGLAIYNQFCDKVGGEFRSSVLDNAVKNSPSFKNFTQEVAAQLNDQLRNKNGDINQVVNFQLRPETRPKFNSGKNLFDGLTILINDTGLTEIDIVDYFIDA
ncbi:MAG: hypothetical protein K2X37_08275, partial [Chitinophagaceae bacterium]|nr:hypothetical protein [Chitinophagaceae bacterium]